MLIVVFVSEWRKLHTWPEPCLEAEAVGVPQKSQSFFGVSLSAPR